MSAKSMKRKPLPMARQFHLISTWCATPDEASRCLEVQTRNASIQPIPCQRFTTTRQSLAWIAMAKWATARELMFRPTKRCWCITEEINRILAMWRGIGTVRYLIGACGSIMERWRNESKRSLSIFLWNKGFSQNFKWLVTVARSDN